MTEQELREIERRMMYLEHARWDIPALVEEIRRLWAVIPSAAGHIEGMGPWKPWGQDWWVREALDDSRYTAVVQPIFNEWLGRLWNNPNGQPTGDKRFPTKAEAMLYCDQLIIADRRSRD